MNKVIKLLKDLLEERLSQIPADDEAEKAKFFELLAWEIYDLMQFELEGA